MRFASAWDMRLRSATTSGGSGSTSSEIHWRLSFARMAWSATTSRTSATASTSSFSSAIWPSSRRAISRSFEASHIALGAFSELALRRRESTRALAQEQLHGATNDGEWAAEVVRHGSQELALDPIGLPQRG